MTFLGPSLRDSPKQSYEGLQKCTYNEEMIAKGRVTPKFSKSLDRASPVNTSSEVQDLAEDRLISSDSETSGSFVGLSDAVLAAQREADEIADEAEVQGEALVDENAPLPAMPKLLALPQQDLADKTRDLKQKGAQLDLLLLKAESYSKFIADNQKRSKLAALSRDNTEATTPISNDSKGKKRGASSSGKRKSAKGKESDSPGDDLKGVSSPAPVSGAVVSKQPPSLVGGTLKPYQLEGLQWLLSLWENGLSGILADEMGLGKTIQIISLIAHLRSNNTPGPFLIAGPLAVLPNWINEFKKWLPSCPVVLYHGSKADRADIRRQKMPIGGSKDMDFPIVVTSFEICMIDRPFLEKYVWQYMILDEGHRIKNRNCKLLRELKNIQTISRLLLTGTPIQNTLEELWSLLNFCSPAIFDDLEVFQSWFGFRNIGQDTQVEDIVQNEHKERVVTKLHDILRPFLLRRMKKDVLASQLPPKREIVLYCGMSSLQREYSAHIHNRSLRETLVKMNIEGAKDSALLNPTMQLRKAANHPFLFGEPKDESGTYLGEANPRLLIMASGKLRVLDRLLTKLKQGGHKVLIFSQMTEMLSILEDYMLSKGWGYCRLDGSTHLEDRQASIDAFNSDPASNKDLFVYMLSTRAGGLGINLTAADTCILFDSDWNPHADSQAQDRCHRIGQTKPVVVYRMLAKGSVEIDMMEKQISKKKLERMTMHGGDYAKAGARAGGGELTLARLRQLLEDDVRNLSRMTSGGTGPSEGVGTATTMAAVDDINDEELSLILDRTRLFTTSEEVVSVDHDGEAIKENHRENRGEKTNSSKSPKGKGKSPEKKGAGKTVTRVRYTCTADIPKEGKMYDILDDTSASSLQTVGY